jgi:hypothetical protein
VRVAHAEQRVGRRAVVLAVDDVADAADEDAQRQGDRERV